MQRIKSISIPTPCHEVWQQMAPTTSGRHCQSCCKTVVDFTAMPNAEIIAYLASHKNTCGRITGSKLAGINHELEIKSRKRFTWKGLLAAASLSMLFPAINAKAQVPPKTEQAPIAPELLGKITRPDTAGYITIKGVIIARDNALPVPGATIKVKGTHIGTQSLRDGSFTLRVPVSAKHVTVSFLGYQTKEIRIRHVEGKQVLVFNPVLESAISGGFDVVNY